MNVPAFADFGIAITVEELKKFRVVPVEGTINYIAPENHLVIAHSYYFACDVWAMGCIFYELLTSKMLVTESGSINTCLEHIFRIIGSPSED